MRVALEPSTRTLPLVIVFSFLWLQVFLSNIPNPDDLSMPSLLNRNVLKFAHPKPRAFRDDHCEWKERSCRGKDERIGNSVRPGNAGRKGVKRRYLHETSSVVQRVRIPPG